MDRRAPLSGDRRRGSRIGAILQLRPVEADDALALGEVLRRSFTDAPSAQYELDELGSDPESLGRDVLRSARVDGHLLLLGELGVTAVAMGRVSPREFQRARHVATLGILVDPAWRGRGVGEALLRGLLRRGFAYDAAIERIELRVAHDDLALRTLAARCGFAVERMEKAALMVAGCAKDLLICVADR